MTGNDTPQQPAPKIPLTIMLTPEGLRVDGLSLSLAVLEEILRCIVHPDSRRWIRFERRNDYGIVHVKMEEQGPAMKCDTCHYTTTVKGFVHCPMDGMVLTSAPELEVPNGRSSEGVGSYGKETQDAHDSRPS